MTGYNLATFAKAGGTAIIASLENAAALRDKYVLEIFGSPDVRQIDGLGGADVLTSKLAIVGPSSREDADVDYTFGQVSFVDAKVDYKSNCGNISAGVGPFAIDNGLVKAVEPYTTVRIHQANTDTITTEDGASYEVSIVDAAIPTVFIKAEALGMEGTETPAQIEGNAPLMARIEEIRGRCAEKIGLTDDWKLSTKKCPYAPFFAVVSELEAENGAYNLKTAAILRTARTIMDGQVYVRKSRIQ